MLRASPSASTTALRQSREALGHLEFAYSVKTKMWPDPCTSNGTAHLISDVSCQSVQPVRRRGLQSAVKASTSSGDFSPETPSSPSLEAAAKANWNQLTDRMVSLSSIPFSVLVLPQVLQNLVNITSGNSSALGIISWEGYLSALLGNTLMCSHFASKQERSAVNVQLIGMFNNLLVLLQVAFVSVMPRTVFFAALAVVALAVVVNLGRLGGVIPAGRLQEGMGIWRSWQLATGIFGLSVVPQVLYNVLVPASPSLLPGLLTAGALMCFFAVKLLGDGDKTTLDATIDQLPGWASTLLFALSPLPQLMQMMALLDWVTLADPGLQVRNFLEPQSLVGLSVGTMLLALLGNALMVPRALLTRDLVWLAGAAWACCAGWGQLLSMALASSPVNGQRYLDLIVFAPVTALLFSYLVTVATHDAQVKGNKSAWACIAEVVQGKAK